MASINGITLKSVESYIGIEGTAYQGYIYLDSKRIGFWSEDGGGGPAWIEMYEGLSEKKFKELITNTYPEKTIRGEHSDGRSYEIPYDYEMFFNDLMCLIDDEKQYKKFLSDTGYGLMVVTDGFHVTNIGISPAYTNLTKEQIKEKLSNKIKAAEEGLFADREIEVNIYRSPDDFNIGIPFTLAQIKA